MIPEYLLVQKHDSPSHFFLVMNNRLIIWTIAVARRLCAVVLVLVDEIARMR